VGTRTRTWLLVTAIAIVVTVVAPAPAAEATTTVTTKGNVVTIHVSVDVIGGKGQTGPEGQSLVDYWEQVLQDTWGSAFDRLPYKNCLKFELDLDLKARSRDADIRAGRDALYVDPPRTGGGWGGVGWAGVPETSRNPRTGDGTRSFEYDRDGTVPVNAPPTVIAHEFGHLFGLGDDRKDGKPKGGREGTVMVGGVPGVDVNVVGEIDQNLINRIGEAIKKHLENKGKKLPTCETWAGTLTNTACNSELVSEGPVTLGVAPDGSVTGTGSVEVGGVCAGIPLDAREDLFGVSGTRDRDGFHLTVADQGFYVIALIDLTVAGTSAEGSAQWSSTLPATATMTLECKKNCEGEAVG